MRQRRLPGQGSSKTPTNRVFTSVTLSKGSSSAPARIAQPKDGARLLRYPSYGDRAASDSAELDSLWMAGFLDHAASTQDEETKANLCSLLSLPGSDILPAIGGILKSHQNNTATDDGRYDGMSLEEKERLESASRRLLTKQKRLRCTRSLATKPKPKPKPKLESRRAPPTPYRAANTKIRKVLQTMHVTPMRQPAQMQSALLEQLIQINRKEIAAAITIQSLWRRCLSIGHMKRVILSYRMAKMIQAIVRGHLARIRVDHIRKSLLRAVFRCQRQYRCRNAWRRWRKSQLIERLAATKCQSHARRWLAGRIVLRLRRGHAATKIQTIWRACQGRHHRVQLWLYRNATVLQCWRRQELARRVVKHLHQMKDAAATHIERWWRGHCARMRRDELLYQRTIEARSNQVRVLAAEEQFWADRLQDLEKRMASDEDIQTWRRNLADLPAKATALEEQIRTEETLLVEQRALRQDLSPRSVEQGWLEQVDRNISITRESITKSKLELVFGVRSTIRQAEIDLQKRTDEVDDARRTHDRYAKWREEELSDLWDCQRQHDKAVRIKSKAQAIADERRRWAVKWTVPSGKPEKDEGPLAEQCKHRVERSTGAFCGGMVDILADSSRPRMGDAEQPPKKEYHLLKSLIERVKLRSHQNEALAFDAVLGPVLKRMRHGPAVVIAKGIALSEFASKKRVGLDRLDGTMEGMSGETKPKKANQKTLGRKAPTRKVNSPKLPRSMPFEDLNRVRADRDAFHRFATSIQNDATSSRWMNEDIR